MHQQQSKMHYTVMTDDIITETPKHETPAQEVQRRSISYPFPPTDAVGPPAPFSGSKGAVRERHSANMTIMRKPPACEPSNPK